MLNSILVMTYAASVNLVKLLRVNIPQNAVKLIMVLSKTKQKLRLARLAKSNKTHNQGKKLASII